MKRHHHRIIAYVLTGSVIATLAVHYINARYQPSKEFARIDEEVNVRTPSQSRNPPDNPYSYPSSTPSAPDSVPSAFFLKVPFTPQAPTANWDEFHNEACEEASAIMAYRYFEGDTRATIPPAEVEVEITKLSEWEKNHFGYHLDINTQETGQMVREVYGLNAEILTDFTEADIKTELSKNRLILWPANGKLLGNPNFRSPGPPYHMLVIKGYNKTGFVANDPGTRNGMNYPYTYKTLYNANGDFDHATHEVDLSKKNVIVVWKE